MTNAKTLIAGLLASLACVPANAADAYLRGNIDASGKPLAGVTVSAKAEGSTVTTSVFTDAKGDYHFPPLDEGAYRVWAQATGFGTAKVNVALKNAVTRNLALAPIADFTPQLSSDEYLEALPEATADDKRIKQVFRNTCTGCHQPSYVLQHKFDEKGWNAILELMKNINVFGVYRGATTPPFAIIDFHQKELAAYLARARGPGPTSMKYRLRPRPSGEAARVVFKEYDVPLDPGGNFPSRYVSNDGSDWSLGTPSTTNGASGVHDIQQDLDGNIWFDYSNPSRHITVARVDAKTGQVKFFKVEGANGYAASSHGITRDQKGILWFNATISRTLSHLARLDPKTEEIKIYPQPKDAPVGGTLEVDGKGKVWASTDTGALRFDPVTETFTRFVSPIQKSSEGTPRTYGVAGDSDGNGWTLQMAIDMLVKNDAVTGKVTNVPLAPIEAERKRATPAEMAMYNKTPVDWNVAKPWSQGPRRGGGDKNAPVVWIANFWGGNLARVDARTHSVSYVDFPNPQTQQPYHALVDDHHNVWVNMMSTDQVMRYAPATKTWTTFDIPTRGTEARYLSVLERNGKLEVVLPYWRTRKVALMSFRSESEIAATKAAGDGRTAAQ